MALPVPLTEILRVQSSITEWRLLAPAARQVVAQGRDIVIVGSPLLPHLPGLRRVGIDERRLVWVRADAPAQRLWVTGRPLHAWERRDGRGSCL